MQLWHTDTFKAGNEWEIVALHAKAERLNYSESRWDPLPTPTYYIEVGHYRMLDIEWEGLPDYKEEMPGAFINVDDHNKITLTKSSSIDEMKLTWNNDRIKVYNKATWPPDPGDEIQSGTIFETSPVILYVETIEASVMVRDTSLILSDTGDSGLQDKVNVTIISVDLIEPTVDEDHEENPGAFIVINDDDDSGTSPDYDQPMDFFRLLDH